MRRQFKPLGACIESKAGTCKMVSPKKLPVEDRLALLEEQMAYMTKAIHAFTNQEKDVPEGANKDGIPIGTVAIGETEKSKFKFYLTVLADGYQVGTITYDSLSAAAQAVSKVRRSGWTFWKLMDGRTLKEAYK